jgi:hypothetical protein
VLRVIGSPAETPEAGVAVIEHLRSEGRRIYLVLKEIQARLSERGQQYERSLVRILDALVWSSHPDTWMFHETAHASGPQED